MATVTKTVNSHGDEPVPYRIGRHVSLRQMTADVAIKGTCADCGLERVETAASLAADASIAGATVADLETILPCQRESCGGAMTFDIDKA